MWVDDVNAAALTDLYELTMVQAYWAEGMHDDAVFSLFVRRLPEARNYLVACGLDDVLHYLETLRFDEASIAYLGTLGTFQPGFLDWLSELRFTGDVYAVREGTPVFADEPILEIVAPMPEAQLVETFVMNQVHHQTTIASKAARVVAAARGRTVIDFGLRRMHGTDAGLKAARACYVAGVDGTSNVLAGVRYGIPVRGTMAHSYVQAHDDERAAFRAFAKLYPGTILLVDTYDTLDGIRLVIEMAGELGEAFDVGGVRLDSGDLAALAIQARHLLDEAGLGAVSIFASSSLDEHRIAALLHEGAPIDGFGVGTKLGVSADAPYLDMVYKLTEFAGRGRLKLAPGKRVLPGRKQVFRVEQNGVALHDVIARVDETRPGRPLLEQVMQNGERVAGLPTKLDELRAHAEAERAVLPARMASLEPAQPAYSVELSDSLRALHDEVAGRVR